MKAIRVKQWLFLLLGFSCCTGLLVREILLSGDGTTWVHTLSVGQGDSILIVSPSGSQILIDGGPNLSLLEHLGKHLPFFDRHIELLIFTHPDADHIAALPSVLKRYSVGAVLLTGIKKDSGRYQAILSAITSQNIPVLFPENQKDIHFSDGLILDIVAPEHSLLNKEVAKANDTSIVLRLMYGKDTMLFTGDIEEIAEQKILESGADLRSTIIKVAHHGSRTSSSTGFLLAVQPEAAIISSGKNNQFGHPHLDVLERYRHFKIPTRDTAREGTISLRFTGK